jgi:hypothetical protein
MKPWLGVALILLGGILSAIGLADRIGPQVVNVDDKISIRADAIPLGNLLRLWDQATGMHSTVPPELANQTLSVRFTGLSTNDALRKIFAGQPFGYLLSEDQLIVTPLAPSEPMAEIEPVGVPDVVVEVTGESTPADSEPSPADIIVMKPTSPTPTYIPTPFGPIVNPGPDRPFIQLPPVFVAPQPPFFLPEVPTLLPAGGPYGPAQNSLFGPLPIYPYSTLPNWGSR